MVALKEILTRAGFHESEAGVFVFENIGMVIEVTYLSVIPSSGFSSGYSVFNTYKNKRTIQGEPSYIPESVDSYEQGLAFLAFAVGRNEERNLENVPSWYSEGKSYRNLLPWEIELVRQREEYDILPKVIIQIEWMRVLIKMLKEWNKIPSKALINFSFNGEFLNFKFGEHQIPIPGLGKPWGNRYTIDVSFLHHLPKRITRRNLTFLIRNNQLQFINQCYDLISAEAI